MIRAPVSVTEIRTETYLDAAEIRCRFSGAHLVEVNSVFSPKLNEVVGLGPPQANFIRFRVFLKRNLSENFHIWSENISQ